jgi:hypothetical protein
MLRVQLRGIGVDVNPLDVETPPPAAWLRIPSGRPPTPFATGDWNVGRPGCPRAPFVAGSVCMRARKPARRVGAALRRIRRGRKDHQQKAPAAQTRSSSETPARPPAA